MTLTPQVAFKDRINRRAQEKIEEQLEEARFVFVAENTLECLSVVIFSARRGISSRTRLCYECLLAKTSFAARDRCYKTFDITTIL